MRLAQERPTMFACYLVITLISPCQLSCYHVSLISPIIAHSIGICHSFVTSLNQVHEGTEEGAQWNAEQREKNKVLARARIMEWARAPSCGLADDTALYELLNVGFYRNDVEVLETALNSDGRRRFSADHREQLQVRRERGSGERREQQTES